MSNCIATYIDEALPQITIGCLPSQVDTNNQAGVDLSGRKDSSKDIGTYEQVSTVSVSQEIITSIPGRNELDLFFDELASALESLKNGNRQRWIASVSRMSIAEKSQIHLIGMNFSNHNLSGLDFSFMNLNGCSFEGATLTDTNFTGASLIGANFKNAELSGTSFSEAILTNAVFDGNETGFVDMETKKPLIAQMVNEKEKIMAKTFEIIMMSIKLN